MASFPLKNAHFSYPFYLTPNLQMFPLHSISQILHAESLDTGRSRPTCAQSLPLRPNA